MEYGEKYRREEARRLVQWIEQNSDEWHRVCVALSDENALIDREYQDVVRILKANGFYHLFVVLLFMRNEPVCKSLERTILQDINERWDENLLDRFIDDIVCNMQ